MDTALPAPSAKWGVRTYAEYAEYEHITILRIPNGCCVFFAYSAFSMLCVLSNPPAFPKPIENVALSANEMFTFEIDSENAIVGCTLER